MSGPCKAVAEAACSSAAAGWGWCCSGRRRWQPLARARSFLGSQGWCANASLFRRFLF